MAPKRIHTRRNPDPEAAIPVFDLEKIVHKRKERPIIPSFHLYRYLSLPKYGVTRIENLEFDVKFEQTLFKTKYESCLNKFIFDKKRFQDLILHAYTKTIMIHTQNQQPLQVLTAAMASRFSPLILPAQLQDFPQEYNQRIKLYDVEGDVSAQKHLDWFNDFMDLEEVDYEDAKMRLFAQNIAREVRKWFKALPSASIQNFEAFEMSFLAKWGDKKNPIQLLT